ncbi:MAG: hypothetical protein CMK59_08870 [Proteobacteria bacterium]|nr:hypothetical protein [Pseudomonadota bacterium]
MSNISSLLNDTEKKPGDVFSFIQEDLNQNSQTKLPEALAWYQHNANETSNYTIQKRNQKWAENAKEILKEGYFGMFELEDEDEDGNVVGRSLYRIGLCDVPKCRILSIFNSLAQIFFEGNIGSGIARHSGGKRLESELTVRVNLQQERFQLITAQAENDDGRIEIDPSQNDPEEAASKYQITAIDGLPDIRAYLTPEQYRQITQEMNHPLIVQGKAGSGKTTVGLYRLAYLTYSNPDSTKPSIDPEHILVVMYNAALKAYVQSSLEKIGLDKAQLFTFHEWTYKTIKEAYRGTIKALTTANLIHGHANAQRIKDRPEIIQLIDDFVQKQMNSVPDFLTNLWKRDGLSNQYIKTWIEYYHSTSNLPFLRRLKKMRKAVIAQRNETEGQLQSTTSRINKNRQQQAIDALTCVLKRIDYLYEHMRNYKRDIRKMFCDNPDLLKQNFPDESDEALQDLRSYQDTLSRKDAPARKNIGSWIGFDDLAIMLRLIQVKHGALVQGEEEHTYLYEHVFVDEAQDLGAIQIKVLLDAVRSKTGITIVGDVNQKIQHNTRFIGWEKLANELQLEVDVVKNLTVSHRSIPEITALCDWILDEEYTLEGEHFPLLIQNNSEQDALDSLIEELDFLLQEHSNHHICVICEGRTASKNLQSQLKQATSFNVRDGYRQNFSFSPGLTISNRQQIKGLEFDAVVVWQPNETFFTNDFKGRCDFYTVCSRAREQLLFVSSSEPASILTEALAQGLIKELKPTLNLDLLDDEEPDF